VGVAVKVILQLFQFVRSGKRNHAEKQ
jgi:hypothetical protein